MMDDRKPPQDDLLDALGHLARQEEDAERQRFDERLRRLSAGTLSAEEEAELRAEAENSDEAREDYETFRPLDGGFNERVLQALPGRRKENADKAPLPFRQPARQRPGTLLTTRPWLSAAAGVTLAALTLWLAISWLTGPAGNRSEFPLPVYSAELDGARQSTRSPNTAPDALPSFTLGSRYELTLTPEAAVATEPQTRFYLAGDDGVLEAWPVSKTTTAEGAVQVAGILGEDLDVAPGSWTLVFLYGRPGELPQPTTLDALEASPGRGRTWDRLRLRFRVLPAAEAGAFGPPLDVYYARCYEVLPGPVCVPYAELVLWLRSEPGVEIEVWVGQRPVIQSRAGAEADADSDGLIDGGQRWRLPVSAADDRLTVVATRAGDETRFELPLRPSEEPSWLHDLQRRARASNTLGGASALDGTEEETGQAALRAELEARLADASPELQGSLASILARLRTTPQPEQLQWLELAVERHLEHGRLLQLTKDLGMLAALAIERRDFARLRRHLESTEAALASLPPAAVPAEATVSLGYHRGILESDVGNFRGALDALLPAAELARRLDLRRRQDLVEAQLALVLQRLGRGGEAATLFARLTADAAAGPPDDGQPDDGHACERAQLLNSYAWTLLLDRDQLPPRPGEAAAAHLDPLHLLEQALELGAAGGCDDALQLNLHLNQALALQQRGEPARARAMLAIAEAFEPAANTLHRLWWQDLRGRLALDEQRGNAALRAYRRMETLADSAFEPQARWRARVQQAAAHEVLGDTESALDAYAAAEAQLDEQTLQVPLDAGRGHFTGGREAGTRRYLDLLLRQGRTVEALDAARRSRARVLSSIHRGHRLAHLSPEQQAQWDLGIAEYRRLRAEIEAEAAGDWRLSEQGRQAARARRAERQQRARRALDGAFQALGGETDPTAGELPPLRAGELVLAYHPLPAAPAGSDPAATPWAGFAARSENGGPLWVEARRLELDADVLADPDELARRLLLPFRDAIEASARIRVLAYGELSQVDFHALPWDGDVLLATRPVVYGLDLDAATRAGTRATAATPRPLSALVIGDPRGDLPAARHEAEAVTAQLQARGDFARIEHLDGERTTLAAVERRLADLDLLHIASHGVRAGWDSALLLAGGSRLTLGDVLALGRAPARVVLSSCDSALDRDPTATRHSGAAGLGLAQAFLVAGSRQVVAALRPVGDRDTEALFRRVYALEASNAGGNVGGGGNGTDLGECLRQAQLAWRAEDPAADWASFRVLEP